MRVPPTFVVAAVVLRDDAGRILVVRKQGTSTFMLPGGKIEAGESAAEAAVREVAEEVGLALADVRPLGHWVAAAANEPGHLVDSRVFTADLPGPPRACAEIAEIAWFDPTGDADEHLAPLLRDHVLPALRTVTVVGIDAAGATSADGARRVQHAEVVIGSERQLGLLPVVEGQVRRAWPSPLSFDLLDEQAGSAVVVLGSGDPLVSGIASKLVRRLGRDRVEVLPTVSSVALARARMRWSAEESTVVTVVGRRHETVLRELAPGRRVLVLSSDETTPDDLALLLVAAGHGDAAMTALGDLGTDAESLVAASAATWAGGAARLHVLAIECAARARPPAVSWASGLPDEAFEHDGQLTKRDLRASALARLAPAPAQLLWDVGAGAGSVGIEWMRAHPTCRTVAVEADPDRAARITRNAARLGVPDLAVVTARAPDGLADLPTPDAVFVGGGATGPGLLARCRQALAPGGRLVVHGVTLETEQALVTSYGELGGELTRHLVEHAEPIGTFTGWRPARAVTQWAWTKEHTS